MAAANEEAARGAAAEQGRALRAATAGGRGPYPTAPLQRRGTGRGGVGGPGRGPPEGSGARHLTPRVLGVPACGVSPRPEMGGGWGSAGARLGVGPRFCSALEISAERVEQPQDEAGGGWGGEGLPCRWNTNPGMPLGEGYFRPPSPPRGHRGDFGSPLVCWQECAIPALICSEEMDNARTWWCCGVRRSMLIGEPNCFKQSCL